MIRTLVVAGLLAAILPLAAEAQQADRAHVATIESCIENYSRGAPQGRVIGGCVGIIDGRCRSRTTIEIADCILAEHRAWDALLNRWWGPMKAAAQADGSWDRLLASQRAWIAEKEAACHRAYDSAGGGSIRVIYGAECHRDWTARKTVEFYYALNR